MIAMRESNTRAYESLTSVLHGRFAGVAVSDLRKQAISIRLGENDVGNVKRIAKRLGVRDSDIIRFAIKSTLSRVAPLCDPAIRGRNLVPVLVESGDELIRYFELDAFRLDSIINDQAESKCKVDRDDIALLAMSGLRDEYLHMHLARGGAAAGTEPARSMRQYLYDKYVYRSGYQLPSQSIESDMDGPVAPDGSGGAGLLRPTPGVI
jgi:hypothetical protein